MPEAKLLLDRVLELAELGARCEEGRLSPRGCLVAVVASVATLVSIGFGIYLHGILSRSGLSSPLPKLVAIFVGATPTLVLLWWIRRTFGPSRPDHYIATLLRHGICASCAYPLRGLPAYADGCLECPECGHAWRHERLVAPAWAPPTASIARLPRRALRRSPVHHRASVPVVDDDLAYAIIPGSRLAPQRSSFDPRERKRLVRAIRRNGLVVRLLAAAPFAFLAGYLVIRISPSEPGEFVASLIPLALFGTLVVLVFRSEMALPSPRRASALLRLGRCPACAGPLPDALEHSRRCPSCRYAWSLAGIVARRGRLDRLIGRLMGNRHAEFPRGLAPPPRAWEVAKPGA